MDIETTRSRGVCVLALAGRLSVGDGVEVLRRRFADLLDGGDLRIVLDLSRLDQIDSAGIGELVACAKRSEAKNAVIRLAVREGTAAARVLGLTHIDRMFDVYPTAEDAVAAFP